MKAHALGFPRIGPNRELKRALEAYWKGTLSAHELRSRADEIQEQAWAFQRDAGLDVVCVGDFSLYDHVLDTTVMVDALPERFRTHDEISDIDRYFHMARGDAKDDIPAMEMTKWFDTNYHYIVPEFTKDMTFSPKTETLLRDIDRARECGFEPKPVLLGPLSYIWLGKSVDGSDKWDLVENLVQAYEEIVGELGTRCEWLQIDEPVLVCDVPDKVADLFGTVYPRLTASTDARVLLATYFGGIAHTREAAFATGCDAIHLDVVRGARDLECIIEEIPEEMIVSLGIVNGRNVWITEYDETIDLVKRIEKHIGSERVMISGSCSFVHVPVDVLMEEEVEEDVREWLSFAVQKCEEVGIIRRAVEGEDMSQLLSDNAEICARRRGSHKTRNTHVRQRVEDVMPDMYVRKAPYLERKEEQAKRFNLPLLPTTTIGSFPQTREIRAHRRDFKKGVISAKEYEEFLKKEICTVISHQEDLELDVLVHGEPERNDMVEYFGEQMNGFCFTRYGWVQSYGSRCVKPPIIFGDISRPKPMTVKWITYAQSQTDKRMKGMLTGPVTMLCWSFVRDDMSRKDVCMQLARALRDEVCDLEEAGIGIIQIDEAAFREGMPLRECDRDEYLQWAVDAFRLTASGVENATQIHSHMCYSEFNTIIDWIAKMDADVISIEASRSGMELLQAFKNFNYPNDIGPGVYDIHSPRIPSKEEMVSLLQAALRVLSADRLWVNPDCGLKTRGWPEVLVSLENMVAAAKEVRAGV